MICDGLQFLGTSFPGNTYDCGNGHLVFSAVDLPPQFFPFGDYHVWRYDQVTGLWSHKPGSTLAKQTDASGIPITNPLLADRGYYDCIVGFFCTCGSLANIQ